MTDKDFTMERFLFNLNTLGELGEEICSPKDFNNDHKIGAVHGNGFFPLRLRA